MTAVLAKLKSEHFKASRLIAGGVLAAVFAALVWAVYTYSPIIIDWETAYYKAARNLLALHSPYEQTHFNNPPWALIPVLPYALLPMRWGYAFWFATGLCASLYTAVRLGAKPLTAIAIMFSYPVLFGLLYGQIDWLIPISLLLPPQWGLFIVLAKPQAGIGIALFWLYQAWKEGGWRQVVRIFAPVGVAFVLSFAIFGYYFPDPRVMVGNVNASLWPQSIPIGLALITLALRKKQRGLAVISSPFLSPYLPPHGWGIALYGLLPYQLETVLVVIGIWIVRLLTGQFLH